MGDIENNKAEVFNEHGMSADDIKKQWDNHWWNGFDTAIQMIVDFVKSDGFFESDEIENQFINEIHEEVENYKKDL